MHLGFVWMLLLALALPRHWRPIWPPEFGCAWACFFTSPPFNYIKPKNKDFLTSVYQANKQKWILILLKPTYAVGYKSSWPQCLVCRPCFAKLVPYIRIQKFYPSPKPKCYSSWPSTSLKTFTPF